jgi:tetratricopeptide (TPR) repeat protein
MKNNEKTTTVRPVGMNPRVWDVLKKVAAELWKEHDKGISVRRKVMISCKEFYEMLLDTEGNLILDNKSLIRFANNGHIKTWSNELLMEAINLMKHGAIDAAIEKLKLHLSLDTTSVNGRLQLADCLKQQGLYRAALSNINEAVHIKPNDESIYIQRAKLYSHLDQDGRALNDLNFALLLNPNSYSALKGRAYLRIALQNIDLAIEDMEKMEALIPNHIETLMLKGTVLFEEKKWPKAYKIFKSVLAIEPHNAEAIVKLALIKIEFKVEEKSALNDLQFARALGHPKANGLLANLLSKRQNHRNAA